MASGLVSVFPFEPSWNTSMFVKYGFLATQHRGGEHLAYCFTRGDSVLCERGKDVEHEVTGPTIYATFNDSTPIGFAEASDGSLRLAALADSDENVVQEFARELVKHLNRGIDALSDFLNLFKDDILPSIVSLTNRGELILLRSSLGISPLSIGSYGFDLLIASSESSVIEILDGEYQYALEPGQLMYVTDRHVRYYKGIPSSEGRLCAFEPLYLMRPDSVVGSTSVYEFRKRLGYELGSKLTHEVDHVLGVPETSYPYAIGVSYAIRRQMELGFVPTPGRPRAMLRKDPLERLIAIHLKMNPIRDLLENKRIALVDDSMVTGTTVKIVSQLLRNKVGVREIHMLIASPKIKSRCPYGYLPIDDKLLISTRLSDDEIQRYLDVDSITWLELPAVENTARECGFKICAHCMGGSRGG